MFEGVTDEELDSLQFVLDKVGDCPCGGAVPVKKLLLGSGLIALNTAEREVRQEERR